MACDILMCNIFFSRERYDCLKRHNVLCMISPRYDLCSDR